MIIDISFVIAALSIGFMGSFHCIGMCGPIAMTMPVAQLQGWQKYIGLLLYNLGRVVTYGLIGAFFGWIGKGFVLFGWQQVLSIIMGILLLSYGLGVLFAAPKLKASKLSKMWQKYIAPTFLSLMKSQKPYTSFTLGLLNGLLPCGLVYMAAAASIASGSTIDGAVFMMLFGLGTLPAMFLISLFGGFASIKFRNIIKSASPIIIGFMGILMILRGMDLNIPYISPQLKAEKIECCHRTL